MDTSCKKIGICLYVDVEPLERLFFSTDFLIEGAEGQIIVCQLLLEEIYIKQYLDNIELVVVGVESDCNARPAVKQKKQI